MSINPKSVQRSEIECRKVKLSAKRWNRVQKGEIVRKKIEIESKKVKLNAKKIEIEYKAIPTLS